MCHPSVTISIRTMLPDLNLSRMAWVDSFVYIILTLFPPDGNPNSNYRENHHAKYPIKALSISYDSIKGIMCVLNTPILLPPVYSPHSGVPRAPTPRRRPAMKALLMQLLVTRRKTASLHNGSPRNRRLRSTGTRNKMRVSCKSDPNLGSEWRVCSRYRLAVNTRTQCQPRALYIIGLFIC
jgi:hypothetical protein